MVHDRTVRGCHGRSSAWSGHYAGRGAVPARDNASALPDPWETHRCRERRRWDIFGKVVDNFGDAGVGWRLARQLAAEHALDVTLWQDDLATLARIAPGIDPDRRRQSAAGVTVRRWIEPSPTLLPPMSSSRHSAAGCPGLRRGDGARDSAPAWFILEYLSAEPLGRQARMGSRRRTRSFRCRGASGFQGSLRRPAASSANAAFSTARDAFRRDGAAQQALWSALGLPAAGSRRNPDLALLLPELRAARAPRRVVRRRRRHRVPRARRSRLGRARSVDRGQRAPPRPPAASRSPDAVHDSVRRRRTSTTGCSGRAPSISSAARTRSSVRNGRRALRVARLSPGRGRALGEARGVPRSLRRGPRRRSGRGDSPVLASVERRRR